MTGLLPHTPRPSGPATPHSKVLRRLVLLVGAAVLIDTAFYAVIAPLLPGLTHQLHLSKAGAGVLTASYPAGMLVASLPGGVFAVKVGPRVAVCVGLTLLGASTLLFGLLNTAAGLDLARFVEGASGACSWAGGVAWLVQASPPERRGVTIGQAVGAAVAGSMGGPAIGALVSVTGRTGLFAGLAGVALVLAAVTAVLPTGQVHATAAMSPDAASVNPESLRAMAPLLRDTESRTGAWLLTLPAIAAGLLTVLGSLQLHHLGASSAQIGIVFLVAAAVETTIAPFVGKLSDRYGRLAPMQAGLLVVAIALALFTLPGSLLLFAALVAFTAAGLATFWAPSMAMMSDAATRLGVEQGLAAAMMNLVWAVGEIVGSAGSGAAAKLGGNVVPSVAVALVCVATFAALVHAGRHVEVPVG
jgi:MFS family permease